MDRVLLLTHRIPYPPDKGDKIRSYHLLQFLRQRYDVYLGCFVDDPEDEKYKDKVASLCAEAHFSPLPKSAKFRRYLKGLLTKQPLTIAAYQDNSLHDWIEALRRGPKAPTVEIAFSGGVAPFIRGSHARRIVDLVDVDSQKWQALAEKSGWLKRTVYAREARLLGAAEAEITQWADATFLVTPDEAALLANDPSVRESDVDYYLNGIDTDYWSADGEQSVSDKGVDEAFDVIFTGAMDYPPNVEAVTWFVEMVWPALQATHPSLCFGIVGARPTAAVQRLGEVAGVTVTGRVEDMRPYFRRAKAAVAPLRIARGIQNKVLEAMAMRTPMVTSPEALTGIGATDPDHVWCADSAEEMVAALNSILQDPTAAEQRAGRAEELIQTQFTWAAAHRRLVAALPSSD